MAKLSLINREKKREKLVAKFAAKRAALEATIADMSASDSDHASRASSCKRCRAMRTRPVCATVANRPVVARSVSQVWFVSHEIA